VRTYTDKSQNLPMTPAQRIVSAATSAHASAGQDDRSATVGHRGKAGSNIDGGDDHAGRGTGRTGHSASGDREAAAAAAKATIAAGSSEAGHAAGTGNREAATREEGGTRCDRRVDDRARRRVRVGGARLERSRAGGRAACSRAGAGAGRGGGADLGRDRHARSDRRRLAEGCHRRRPARAGPCVDHHLGQCLRDAHRRHHRAPDGARAGYAHRAVEDVDAATQGDRQDPRRIRRQLLLHSKPPGDRELLPDEKLAEEIREAWRAGDWLGLAALREQQRKLDLKPSGGGTYKADKNGFDVNVAKDGMTHLKDKPTFDATDAMMRAVGIDPYASEKLRVLDRTREHRAIMQHRATRERLAHSGQLMQSHISRLWASTADLAARKQGLFELWDDCAETGSDELVAGGAEARKLVIAWIQLKLRDADAYTADELAQLNAKRKSQERFEP